MHGTKILLIGAGDVAGDALRELGDRDRSIVVEILGPGQTPPPGPGAPEAILIEVSSATAEEALGWVDRCRARAPDLPVLLAARDSNEDLVIGALRAGATDYLRAPLSVDQLAACLDRCGALRPLRSSSLSAGPGGEDLCARRLVGDSAGMQAARAQIAAVAPRDSNVLVTGETGTGKELAAALIHDLSPRRRGPFVRVNCAALPDTLLESELFGHERGAFTGAQAARDGLLRSGQGGTVLLDEIGEMSSLGQAKILRAVECKEVHRLGGRDRLVLDVRWIASTNRDLERGLAEQRFRADLFYRLNVARVHLPPLRDRIEDLPSLLDRFIREFNVRFGLSVEGFTDEALRRLLQYRWPGNVREVRNLVEATFVGLPPRRISCVDLPPHFRDRLVAVQGGPEEERLRLLSALFSANWNKSQAARALRWSRMTLYRKMRRYQVSPRAPIGEARPEHAVPGL